MSLNYNKDQVINEIINYLENFGEIDIRGSISYTTKEEGDWYLSMTNIHNKLSLLVSYKKEILISINFPVYISAIGIYTLAIDINTDYTKWFSLLKQVMIITDRKDNISKISKPSLYRFSL